MEWWKKAVVYQIYPMSFKDSNGDGMGDLGGVLEKVDYLKELGVDIVWMTPIYESPMDDNGYDISNYYKINPLFGTMEQFDQLLDALHERGIRLIMDLVVNHTSDEHEWFRQARKDKNSKYHDYYIWKERPITDQQSFFSGSVWEYNEETEEYYYHLFSRRQPDLNWDNPEVRKEVYRLINWWLDKGIDGFRMDVIDLIVKIPEESIMYGVLRIPCVAQYFARCIKHQVFVAVIYKLKLMPALWRVDHSKIYYHGTHSPSFLISIPLSSASFPTVFYHRFIHLPI